MSWDLTPHRISISHELQLIVQVPKQSHLLTTGAHEFQALEALFLDIGQPHNGPAFFRKRREVGGGVTS